MDIKKLFNKKAKNAALPTILKNKKEVACIVFTKLKDVKSLKFSDQKLKIEWEDKSTERNVNFDMSPILKPSGEFCPIGGNCFVSNEYTFVKLWLSKQTDKIAIYEYGVKSIKQVGQDKLDNVYKLMTVSPVAESSSVPKSDYLPESNNIITSIGQKNAKTTAKITAKTTTKITADPLSTTKIDENVIREECQKNFENRLYPYIEDFVSVLKSITDKEELFNMLKKSPCNLDMMLDILKVGVETLQTERHVEPMPEKERTMPEHERTEPEQERMEPEEERTMPEPEAEPEPESNPEQEETKDINNIGNQILLSAGEPKPVVDNTRMSFDCQNKALEFLNKIVEQLNAGGYVCNCKDDTTYNDNLAMTFDPVIKQIMDFTAIDEDDMKAKISEELRVELGTASSGLCKLGCYKAYSKVDFITESESRKEGVYVVREKIDEVYETVMQLLDYFDFEQQIPQLFKEELSDERYEDATGNTVSCLEQLYGSKFREHYQDPERPKLIMDIAELGFTDQKNGDGKKTKVLLF